MKRISVIILLLLNSQILICQNSILTNVKAENLNGELISLADCYKNGPLYIDFWALWCQPCLAEIKALQGIENEFKDKDVTIIGINIDSPKGLAKVKSFISSWEISYPILLDPNSQIFNKLNGQYLPYSILFDTNGKIVKIRTGFQMGDEKSIKEDILKLIKRE